MIIDKTYGNWDLIYPPIIDDIAYYLFIENYINEYNDNSYLDNVVYIFKFDPPCQSWFKITSRDIYGYCNNKYYENAKLILKIESRKQKLNKLNEII